MNIFYFLWQQTIENVTRCQFTGRDKLPLLAAHCNPVIFQSSFSFLFCVLNDLRPVLTVELFKYANITTFANFY